MSGFPVFLGYIFTGVGAGAFFYAKGVQKKAAASRFWPTVKGEVKRSNIIVESKYNGSNHQSSYKAVVQYKYKVNSRSYTNDKILVGGQLQMALKKRAEAHCHNYSVKSEVEVHYNPDNPAEAYLETREETAWFIQLIGGFFAFMGMGVILGLFR